MPPFVGHVAPLQSSEKMALRVLDLVCMTDEQSLLTSAAAVMPQTAAAAAEMPPNEPQSFKGWQKILGKDNKVYQCVPF